MSFIIIGARVGGVYSQEPTPDGDPYDLGTVPFAYDWPTAPTTTGTVNVTTYAELVAAVTNATSGRIINIAAGTYTGDVNVNTSDLDIRCSNSATLTGQYDFGLASSRCARVKWTGGNFIDGMVNLRPFSGIDDLLFDDVYIDADADYGSLTDSQINFADTNGFSRVAFINSTIKLHNGNSSGGWAMFANMEGNPVTGTDGSFIFANCRLESDAQNNRFMECQELIIVDCVTNADNVSVNGMRIHQECNNVYIKDTSVVGSFQMNNSSVPNGTNCTYDGLHIYSNDFTGILHGGLANTGSLENCVWHSSSGGSFPDPSPFTDAGGNSWVSWDGSTLPDFSAYGAVRP
jgi:predicted secreted protein